MKNHLVEIYLDSYSSEPFVTEMSESTTLDRHVCHWLETKTGQHIDVESQLKIEDVSHPHSSIDCEATRLRISLDL